MVGKIALCVCGSFLESHQENNNVVGDEFYVGVDFLKKKRKDNLKVKNDFKVVYFFLKKKENDFQSV